MSHFSLVSRLFKPSFHRRAPVCAALLIMAPACLCAEIPATAQSETNATSATIQSALLAAARNALKLADTAGAVFYYNRYLQQQPDDRAVLLELAGVLTQADHFEEALAACNQALRNDPSNPEAQKLKVIALGRLGRAREAMRLIADLRARFPDDLELQKIEAGFRALQGDSRFSRDLYRDLLVAGFNNVKDWQDYLDLLAADRQWELLLETYESYRARLAPNDPIRFAVLRANLAKMQWREVEQLFLEITTPELRREAAILVADQFAAAGRLDDAIRFLEPVLNKDDPDPNLTAKLALLEAYNKYPARAMQRLNALPRQLQTDKVNITRAKIIWAAGRPGNALAELENLALADSQIEAVLAQAGLLYDLHREWKIPPLLARIFVELQHSGGAERKLAWCLLALAHIRAGDDAAARTVVAEFKRNEPVDLAPDILLVMIEQAARRTAAKDAATALLGARLRDFQPNSELIRPALLDEVPSTAWRMAWEARPSNRILLLKLAKALFREGRIADAGLVFEQSANFRETGVEAAIGATACALRQAEMDKVKRLPELLHEAPLEFPQLISAARLMLKAGYDGLAESFYARIKPAYTNHPDALVVRAAWLIRAGREHEARAILAQVQPESVVENGIIAYLYQRMAELAKDTGDKLYTIPRERLSAMARADSLAGSMDAMLPAADLLIRGNENNAALDLFKAPSIAQRDLRVCERLLVANIRVGNYEEAERQIRSILARRPGDAASRALLARIALWQSNYPLAWRRYDELVADYPEDRLVFLEREAKQSRALERHRRSATAYAEYTELLPGDREMAAENADAWFLRDFSKAAADRYKPATWAFPDDADLAQSLAAAQRRSNFGAHVSADYLQRLGNDRKVDVEQSGFEGGITFPRGPDALTLEAAAGLARFQFDDIGAETLNARRFDARARKLFTNGVEIAGAFEMLDFQTLDTSWRGNLDIGYQGLDGWKVALIGGRQDMRENYYTMLDSMENYWIGLYAQWQPTERIRFFGQYRVVEIPAPSDSAIVPTNYCTSWSTQTVGRVKTIVPAPAPGTWEKNHAYEGVAEASYQLFFAPRSFRLWVNVYRYETEECNDLYWTPEDAFVSGQIGLHWRHSLGARQFAGSPLFYYGVYAAISRNTDEDTSPTLKGELGWNNGGGWSFAAEAAKTWGDKYEESSAFARLDYRF